MRFKTPKSSISLMLMLLIIIPVSLKASENNIDKRVDELLSRMTVEEKVGQMTQISLEFISRGYPNTEDPLTLDSEKLHEVIVEHHVGSILNVGTHAHTAERWQEIITDLQNMAVKKTRLGIPVIYGIDAVHGANYTKGATLFPQSIAMAATWNRNLSRQEGEITAYEVRASGISWNFNPVMGMGRQPLWPRLWETYGEDPYLASVMGYEYIKGLEGENNTISQNDKVAACMKHYLGYSFPMTGQDRTPAWIPERMLREYFVPPFQAAVDAGVSTVMVNSSEINGIPVHASPFYLKQLLFDEMGFEGFVVSDWLDIHNLYQREKVAVDYTDAIKQAVMAGVDMSMVPLDLDFYTILIDLVKKEEVPVSRIDEAVRRILKVKFRLGLFDNPYPDPSLLSKVGCEKFRKINRQAAREAITLLENKDSFLPLKENARLLVTGPTANKLSVLNGGWTITWQGDQEELYPQKENTIFKALSQKFGKHNVKYIEPSMDNIKQIIKETEDRDAVILCLGEQPYCETPGNISDLTLEQEQLHLAKSLYQTNVPVILVLVEGRPRIIREIEPSAQAILMAYLPGIQGGNAIADVLSGTYNPSGKLPITYPRFPNDLTLYDHKPSEDINEFCSYNPQWPFGYGLSYTTFEFSDLKLDKKVMHDGEELKISVTVKNSGPRQGKEVVQLYIADNIASVTPSSRRLKRFSKISLEPEENKEVEFTIQKQDLVFIGRANKPRVEPGEFNVLIGGLKATFTYQ
ncbi:MAG: glycoside hydrolase family 3 N-terminal domain-containing protein [bacterium]